MNDLWQQFLEDRALRDAARANFLADLEHARTSLSGKGIAERVVDRIGEGARDVLEQASETAEDNRGILAVLIGAIVLWFARGPILELLGLEEAEDNIEIHNMGDEGAENSGIDSPLPLSSGDDDDTD